MRPGNGNNTATWNGAKLWENVLEKSLSVRSHMHQFLKGTSRCTTLDSPKRRSEGRQRARHRDFEDRFDIVIDAKYYDDLSSVMKGSSNYQMLGYALSALASKGKDGPKRVGPRTVAFAVPTRKAEGVDAVHANPRFEYKMQLPFTIIEEEADVKPPTLHGLEIEFPNVEVYTDEDNWDDYFERVSKSFKEVVSNFIQNLGEDSENI